MNRRDSLLALLAFAATGANAQHPERMKRIAALMPFPESDAQAQAQFKAFLEGLQQLGWTGGRNVRIETRWSGAEVSRIRTSAKELVESKPDVIFCRATPVAKALLLETRTIPIVFAIVSDPVGDGLVASMARPGGNVTGFTGIDASVGGKWLQLLKEIAPSVVRVGILFNARLAAGGGTYYLPFVESAAPSIGVKTISIRVQDAAEIERALAAFTREPNGGLLVLPDVTTLTHRELIVSLAAQHRLPAIYSSFFYATDRGLISYGLDFEDLFRRAASYVDRILRGENPSELPVQSPIKFFLVINLNTAKALGITIPNSLRLRADKVIQQ
ncbi:MAG: ABC transporter substrate-binding protein [Gemmatimonadaceae bacterium]